MFLKYLFTINTLKHITIAENKNENIYIYIYILMAAHNAVQKYCSLIHTQC